jgi:hypothetical protein
VVKTIAALAVLAIAALAIASCTLFQDDIPDRSCRADDECFRAQGEICDEPSQTCIPGPDAAPPDATATAKPEPPYNEIAGDTPVSHAMVAP